VLDISAVVRDCGVVGFCAIRPPVNCDTGGETVIGLDVARGLTRPVACDVDLDAMTAGALSVVGVRVWRCVVLTVLVFVAGVPPVTLVVVVDEPRGLDDLDEPPLDEPLDEPPPREPPLDEPPLDEPPLDPPREPPLDEPPPREPPLDEPPPREPPLDEPPLDPPAPADPVPERRAIIYGAPLKI
jgi:hypothetical protein